MVFTVGALEIPTWLLLTGLAVVLGYFYSTRNHDVFTKAGIPGPRPLPFYLGMLDMLGKSVMDLDLSYRKKYGKFVGTFQGSTPNLLVMDGDWLKEAFIKNFDLTSSRNAFTLGGAFDYGLITINGDHWRHVRNALSPTFAQARLKAMIPAINSCEDTFMAVLSNEEGKSVDMRMRLNALTLDVIANTAFGIKVDTQTNPDSKFLKSAVTLVKQFESSPGLLGPLKVFGRIILLLTASKKVVDFLGKFGITLLDRDATEFFESLSNQVIKDRTGNPDSSHNFIQSVCNKIVEVDESDPDLLYDELGNTWTRKGLLKNDVHGNAVTFLFAGFQTTADSMLFAFFELAHHQDKQQKAYEEVVSVMDTDSVTIERIGKLNYLDQCVKETMRLYPQVFRLVRVAAEDFTVRGIQVKKGMMITGDNFVCHRDPDVWEEPDEFVPERFSDENMPDGPPSAYMPFGIGNRSCIGNRLALLEMKMTLARTLKAFRIECCPETPTRPVKFKKSMAVVPETDIYVKFTRREK